MAKRVPPLTAMQVANLKPSTQTIELVDGAVPGLRLRMPPTGTKSWSLNIRDAAGNRRRFDVGVSLGLAEARRKAEELRQRVRAGEDPSSARRASRARATAAANGIGTLDTLVETYFSTGPGAGLRTKREQLRRIRFVFGPLLTRPALDLNSVDLQLALDAHPATVSAARAAGYINPILAWAGKRDLVKGPFELEKPVAREDDSDGHHVLTAAELKAILPQLTDAHGRCAMIMLLTAARREEVCAATWAEFDLDAGTWTIAAGRRKDTRSRVRRKQAQAIDHTIPLPHQAVALLRDARAAEEQRRALWNIDEPIGDDDFVFVGDRGAKLQNWDRWLKRIARASGISGWSAHTLRRTAATLAADLGAEPHIISVLLGHKNVGTQLTAVYSKSRYRNEHAEALQRLADFVHVFQQ